MTDEPYALREWKCRDHPVDLLTLRVYDTPERGRILDVQVEDSDMAPIAVSLDRTDVEDLIRFLEQEVLR